MKPADTVPITRITAGPRYDQLDVWLYTVQLERPDTPAGVPYHERLARVAALAPTAFTRIERRVYRVKLFARQGLRPEARNRN